jgi:hypothetical protein
MQLTQTEENKNKALSILISLGILGLLLLFLFLFIIPIPNPLFPETTAGGGGGTEINFGTYNEGTGNVENDGIGDATSVVENTDATPPPTPNENSENIVTSETGEDVNIAETKPKVENNTTVITPTKPKVEVKPKTAAELLKEKFLKNQGKNGGGDGNSGHAGNDGSPDGNPNTHGTGGTGGGDGGGDGPGKGPGGGPGNGGVGFSLAGRSMVKPPSLPKNITEEGKVVVEIVVDKNGNVIRAEANGRGTNTNSSNLKTIARQAAFATKFNVSGAEGEQKGTLTMVFSF